MNFSKREKGYLKRKADKLKDLGVYETTEGLVKTSLFVIEDCVRVSKRSSGQENVIQFEGVQGHLKDINQIM